MLTLADCEDTVLTAIYKANKRYAHWSNGLWLNDAGVEAMVCYEIAEEFANHKKRGAWSIGLEVSYADLEEFSGAARKPGKPPALVRSGARADVVLFDGSDRPKYVIEVKRSWSRQGVLGDGQRIGTILRRAGKEARGSIRAGLLAIFDARRPNSRRDDAQVEDIRHDLLEELKTMGFAPRYRAEKWEREEVEGKGWSYRGVCCSFSRPSASK